MTDKVRIDSLGANSLNGNNETYLAMSGATRASCR